MDTCSNCGAPVRPGAKFCTGCGNRLNDVDTSGSGPSGWNETAPVEDAPPVNEPAVGRVVSTRIVTDGATDHAPRPTVAANEQPATTWTWGSLETDDPAARVPVTPADEREPASSPAVAGVEPSPTSEPFQWSWDTPSNGEPAADASATGDDSRPIAELVDDAPTADGSISYRPAHAPTVEATVEAEVVAPESADAPPIALGEPAEPVTNIEAEAPAEDPADRDAREAELADAAPPYDWRQSVTYGYEEKSPSVADAVPDATMPPAEEREEESLPVFAATDSDSSSDGSTGTVVEVFPDEPSVAATTAPTGPSETESRALDLLDELRSLIPALGAESAGSQGQTDPAMGEAVSAAVRELDEVSASVGESSGLRAVLEAARSRPRDMDAVLDLVGQAGSLIDLLDERDRLAAAIEQAASSLRATS